MSALEGKRILITGGSAGIGLHLADQALARGAAVAVCGRDASRLAASAERLPGAIAVQADVGEVADVARLGEVVAERWGGLDVLVNNAAIQNNFSLTDRVDDGVLDDIAREVAINLTGLVQLTATCMPLLLASPSGCVVNVSSGLALMPKRSAPVYCATKAAVGSFSRSLRLQTRKVEPGFCVLEAVLPVVDTDMTHGRGKDKLEPAEVARQILRGVERRRDHLHVGKIKLFAPMARFAPRIAQRIVAEL